MNEGRRVRTEDLKKMPVWTALCCSIMYRRKPGRALIRVQGGRGPARAARTVADSDSAQVDSVGHVAVPPISCLNMGCARLPLRCRCCLAGRLRTASCRVRRMWSCEAYVVRVHHGACRLRCSVLPHSPPSLVYVSTAASSVMMMMIITSPDPSAMLRVPGLLIVAAVLVVGSISETCTPPAKKKRGQTPNPARCAASALRERAGAPSEHSSSVAAAAPPSSADGSYDVSMLRRCVPLLLRCVCMARHVKTQVHGAACRTDAVNDLRTPAAPLVRLL